MTGQENKLRILNALA